MPVPGADPTLLSVGPGYLYYAALGTAEPVPTVAGSVFTDVLPGTWVPLGYTEEGSEFTEDINTAGVDVAEEFYQVAIYTTGKVPRLAFALAQVTLTNVKRALNGGVITVSGSGATQLNTYDPPDPGAEVRSMIIWEDELRTQRALFRRCFNIATTSLARRKAPNNTTINFQFQLEKPASVKPYVLWTAGVARG
jgi:hypothetical protein